MNEDKLKNLLEKDANLREAIREEEAVRPQLPPTLNARLLQRVSEEQKEALNRKRRKRIIWPWVAAACVAAVLVFSLHHLKIALRHQQEGLSRKRSKAL